ncbi:hypothetical protein CFELI_00495 [Corynebacterium felinum]|uniref:Uncharacterized protein n=1 Tax=Corynebacterium felinum TaxID=131318 RepID=A0ABU2B702_9CORY|nr:hypothetical protein [Corynebacterium felinum]WJY93756.1 hypothetical protein CFELI_00495 [Corynebacterium felinum]
MRENACESPTSGWKANAKQAQGVGPEWVYDAISIGGAFLGWRWGF